MRPKVEEISQKEEARAKASSARVNAKGSMERKACKELMKETRPSGILRPNGPMKDGPRRRRSYDEDDETIAAFCVCVCCPEPLMSESDDPFMCLLPDKNDEEQVCAITFDDDVDECDDELIANTYRGLRDVDSWLNFVMVTKSTHPSISRS